MALNPIVDSTGTILNRYTVTHSDQTQEDVTLTFNPSPDYVAGTPFAASSMNPVITKINDLDTQLADCSFSVGVDGKPYITYEYDGNTYTKKLGSSEGTATTAQVLAGATFGSSVYDDLATGTMPDRGAVNQTLTASTTTYTVPQGYHNGSGKVKINTQSRTVNPTKAGQTVTPTDSSKVLSRVIINPMVEQTVSVNVTVQPYTTETIDFEFTNMTTVFGVTKLTRPGSSYGQYLLLSDSGSTGNGKIDFPYSINGNTIKVSAKNISNVTISETITIKAIGV